VFCKTKTLRSTAIGEEHAMALSNNPVEIQKLYVAYFSRPADVLGLQYWAGVVGAASGSTAIAAGAQGTDLTAFRNKVTVAMAFTAELDTAAEIAAYGALRTNSAAKLFITGISDDASAAAAAALVPASLRASVDAVLHLNDGPLPPPVAVDHADVAAQGVTLIGTAPAYATGLHLI
jgi:hypothetical protein